VQLMPDSNLSCHGQSLSGSARGSMFRLRLHTLQWRLRHDVRLSPDVRQPVKTLLTVRWKILDRQYDCTAYWEPAGEAEAVPAGEQTAEE